MHSIDYQPRRSGDRRTGLPGGRRTVLAVVGALAIAAIVVSQTIPPEAPPVEIRPATPVPTARPPAAAATSVPAKVVPTAAAAPTAAATAIPPAAAQVRTHTVASGDTLMSIASKYYGDPSRWTRIAEANKDILPDPGILQVGQKLKIPE